MERQRHQKERLCGVTVPKGEVTIVHYSLVGSETTGTAVLRTRMAGGVGGAGSIPVPTRFSIAVLGEDEDKHRSA